MIIILKKLFGAKQPLTNKQKKNKKKLLIGKKYKRRRGRKKGEGEIRKSQNPYKLDEKRITKERW